MAQQLNLGSPLDPRLVLHLGSWFVALDLPLSSMPRSYPVLRRLKNDGDPSLSRIDIVTALWSLHCYRRGAHTHVSIRLPRRKTRVSKEMVYGHGRLRYSTHNLPIDVMYLQWSYKDRIKMTRLFMLDLGSPLGLPMGLPVVQLGLGFPAWFWLRDSSFTLALGS